VNKPKLAVWIGLGVAALLVGMVFDYFNRESIPHQSMQLHVRLVGASIYEFHDKTGRWPSRAEDLSQTSLPLKSPYWKQMLDRGLIVVVWRQDLKPDPKENAALILAYYNKGLFSRLGRLWVCWGDLRMEYAKTEEVRGKLPGVGE